MTISSKTTFNKANYLDLLNPGIEIQCNSGWYALIEYALLKIRETAKKAELNPGEPGWPHVDVIKEKFGEIRIYFTGAGFLSEKINSITVKALEESRKTCDVCGEAGKLVKIKSLMATRCEKHSLTA